MIAVSAILSGKSIIVKSCCAIGCSNRASKSSAISFYRFPSDPKCRVKWILAVKRENWQPMQHSWICSAHFINGKSDDPLSPDYVLSIFDYVRSPLRRKRASALEDYHRKKRSTATRVEATMRMEAASSLLVLQTGSGTSSSTSREESHAGKSTQTEPISIGTQTEITMSSIMDLKDGLLCVTKEPVPVSLTKQRLFVLLCVIVPNLLFLLNNFN